MSQTESLSQPEGDRRLEELCQLFERAWSAGPIAPRLEDFLPGQPPAQLPLLLERLLRIELRRRRLRRETPAREEYLARFPQHRAVVERAFAQDRAEGEDEPTESGRAEPVSSSEKYRTYHPLELESHGTTALGPGEAFQPPDDHNAWWPTLPGFDILEVIGQGGMGVVYRARQQGFDREVAIKMVSSATQTPTQRRRFLAEGRAISQLRHPHIVEVYTPGEYRGQPYFVMELVTGGTLRHQIDSGCLKRRDAVAIVMKVARAMHHAHQHQIVHRDLKPGNILLTKAGEPKVTDFGVAKIVQDAPDEQTRVGAVIGTPEYMSPEQASGEVRNIGPAADIYSLGVILFECLSGQRPIEGASQMETIQLLRSAAPQTLYGFLKGKQRGRGLYDLEAICQKCLEKEPPRRYSTAEQLADELQRWLEGEPVQARPIGRFGRTWRWSKRQPVAACCVLLLSLLVLTLMAAAPVFMLLYNKAALSHQEAIVAEKQASEQRDQARNSETEARKQQREAGRRIARLYASMGSRQLERGDYFRALVWTTEALERETDLSPGEPGTHPDILRLRIAALLDGCPRLVHALPTLPWVERVRLDESGAFLLGLDAPQSRLGRWRLETGADVSLRFQPRPAAKELVLNDDQRALVQHQDGSLRLWDASTGRALQQLKAPPSEGLRLLTWLSLPHKQGLFAVFEKGAKAEGWLWALDNGRLLSPQPERLRKWGPSCVLQASADGSRLLIRTEFETRLLDTRSGQRLARSDPPDLEEKDRVKRLPKLAQVTLSADGLLLAGSDGGRLPVVWDLTTFTQRPWPEVFACASPVTAVRFMPQRSRLLVLSGQVRAKLWSLENGKVEPASEWLVHGGAVRDGWFSPDERFLLTVSEEGSARVWDTLTSLPLTPPLRHESPVATAAWSADGRRVLTRARDGGVRVWDLARLASPLRVLLHDGAVTAVKFSPDGEHLLTGSEDGTARLWNVGSGLATGLLRHAGPVTAVRWDGDGKRIATLSEKSVRVWNAVSGDALTPPLGTLLANRSGVSLTRFRPQNGELLLVFADRANLTELGPPIRDVMSIHHEDNGLLRHAAFSPEGKTLATADVRNEVRIWQVKADRSRHRFVTPGQLSDLVFLTPEQLALTGTFGLIVRDVQHHRELLRVPAKADEFRAAHLNADGKHLLTVNLQNACQVWDVASGKVQGPAVQAAGPVRLATTLANGQHTLTILENGEMRLWDTATGEPLTPPERLGVRLADACLSPDGSHVALAGGNGKAYLWKLPARDLRPERQLSQMASLLAAEDVAEHTETLQTLSRDDLSRLSRELPANWRKEFQVPREQVRQWHRQQADFCERAGQKQAVLFHLDHLLQLQPNHFEFLIRRAEVLATLGRLTDAITDLTTLVNSLPLKPVLRARRARLRMLAGQWKEALADITEALKRDPKQGNLWLKGHLLLLRLEQPAAAQTAYRKALELGIDLTYRPYFFGGFSRDPQQTYQRQRQWQPEIDDLTVLLDLGTAKKDSKEWLSALHRCRGVARGALGEWATARDDFQRAATLTAKRDGEIERGLALAARMAPREKEDALEHASRAIKEAEKDGSLWYLRACLQMQRGRAQVAELLRDLNHAIERGADHPLARRHRGKVLLALRRFDAAEADFTVVIENSHPKSGSDFHARGLARAGQQKWKEAAADLGTIADALPEDATAVRQALLIRRRVVANPAEMEAERQRRLRTLLAQPIRTMENSGPSLGEVIWTAVLFPNPGAALAPWLPFFEKASKSPSPNRKACIAGAARCRLGDFKGAQRSLQQACAADGDGGTAWDWYFLALTHHGLKEMDKGREALKKARAWTEKQKTRGPLPWDAQLELALLEAETAQLLGK